MGPAQDMGPGETLSATAGIALADDLDVSFLQYATSESLPLTVEVFIGRTSFWLTHALLPSE